MSYKVQATIRVRTYPIIDEAVEAGVKYGWNRAHKHVEDPEGEQIIEAIHDAVMGALCEVLVFDEPVDP